MFRRGAWKLISRQACWRTLAIVGLAALTLGFGSAAYAKYASIVIDAHSGQVLYSKNADTRNYPASLTKMMTLYLLFEAIDEGRLTKSSMLKVSARAARQSPSKLGLRTGQKISVDDAIRALSVKSANDVAVVVAEALGGTEAKFAKMMTQKAHQIGMSKTNFANASGLPNRAQLSTARDMARLAQALYFGFPHHYHYFGLTEFTYKGRRYKSHNKVLTAYKGTDGLKTGYTRASGYNLATSVERNGRRLIGIVFGGKTSRSRNAHMIGLLDRSWPKLQTATLTTTPKMKPADLFIASFGAPVAADDDQIAALDAPANVVPVPPAPKQQPTITASAAAILPAAIEPKPAETLAAIAAAPPRGDWAIQVGAYYRRDQAIKAVDFATEKMPSLLGQADAAIVLMNGKRKPIYRARLVGFESRGDAQTACRALKKKSVPCFAIKQDKNAQLAAID